MSPNLPTGLVIGKFSPLHLGHDYLIRQAQSQSSRLTVVVFGSTHHAYSLQTRLAWLREAYPEVAVFGLSQDGLPKDNPAAWIAALESILPEIPQRYFDSELSGAEYAKLWGIEHVMVDLDRSRFPISASKITSDPTAYAEFVHPVARADLFSARMHP